MNNENDIQRFSYDEVFTPQPVECDRQTDAFYYFEGMLSEKAKSEFQEHLKKCIQCAKAVLEVHELQQALDSVQLHDDKAKQIFDQNRVSLRAQLDAKYGADSEIAK